MLPNAPGLSDMRIFLASLGLITSFTSVAIEHHDRTDAGNYVVISADDRPNTGAQDFLRTSAPPAVPQPKRRQWVRVSQDVRLTELAADLNLSVDVLTKLNELSADVTLKKGQWVVLPQLDELKLALSSFLDAKKVSNTAPLAAPPSLGEVVKVTSTDSLTTIATRHGLSLSELRQLNPGVNLARLVIGSELRVANAAPRALLAIRPGVSGGASWPSLPQSLGGTGRGPTTPKKERIRSQIEQNKEAQRQALLRAEEAKRRRYKTFGKCTYDWLGWGKSPSGIRSTTAFCRPYSRIELAVDCKALKVSKRSLIYSKSSWSG